MGALKMYFKENLWMTTFATRPESRLEVHGLYEKNWGHFQKTYINLCLMKRRFDNYDAIVCDQIREALLLNQIEAAVTYRSSHRRNHPLQ